MVLDSKAYDQVSLGLLHLELRGSSIGHNGAFSPQWLIFCEPVEPTHAAGARKPIRATVARDEFQDCPRGMPKIA